MLIEEYVTANGMELQWNYLHDRDPSKRIFTVMFKNATVNNLKIFGRGKTPEDATDDYIAKIIGHVLKIKGREYRIPFNLEG